MKPLTKDETALVREALTNYLDWFDGSQPGDAENMADIQDALDHDNFETYMNLDGAISDWITNLEEADAVGFAQEIAILENVLQNKL